MTDMPILEATLRLDEVHKAAGAMRPSTLRRHLKRNGSLKRYGNEYLVDSAVLARTEPNIHAAVIRNRMMADPTPLE